MSVQNSANKRLSSLSSLTVGDVKRCMMFGPDDGWDDFLLMNSNLCLQVHEKEKTADASTLEIMN
jgi:hypothetical protein